MLDKQFGPIPSTNATRAMLMEKYREEQKGMEIRGKLWVARHVAKREENESWKWVKDSKESQ